ncbi:thioredoxin family protein [Teredinibacter purpureus]|uniref:thioredoxin family protein n=1 Tax=Teredinibacter purpureus TaxID=2731756 RepID=UPI0009E3ED5D|nr:thioredoxin family protein [Teredinibacter purpureus]
MSDQSPSDQNEPPSSLNTPQKKRFDGWRSLLFYGGILAVFYFGHVQIQTYLGEQALEKVTLERLTLDEALARSASTGKPVLADISAIWCPSCRKLDNQVLAVPSVQQAIEDRFIFTRIEFESEEGERVQAQYNVKGFPTLLILNANGTKIRDLPLTFDPEAFKSLLSQKL